MSYTVRGVTRVSPIRAYDNFHFLCTRNFTTRVTIFLQAHHGIQAWLTLAWLNKIIIIVIIFPIIFSLYFFLLGIGAYIEFAA